MNISGIYKVFLQHIGFLNTKGQLLTHDGTDPAILGIGAESEVLKVVGGAPVWSALTPSALNKKGETILGEDNATIQVTGLDLDTDLTYLVVFNLEATGSAGNPTINLTVNGSGTGDGYVQRLTQNSTTLTGTAVASGIIASTLTRPSQIQGYFIIKADQGLGSDIPSATGQFNYYTTGGMTTTNFGWLAQDSTNITSIEFVCTVATKPVFKAGSSMSVYVIN